MARARMMDKPEDFAKLGINPKRVETWEDGRRDGPQGGRGEETYFDVIADDGSKVVIYFHSGNPMDPRDGYTPEAGIMVTTPDGVLHNEGFLMKYAPEEFHLGTDKCDWHVGPHSAVGDFKTYDVHIDPQEGVGADLHFDALVDPFRQGTAYVALGDNDENYYTDLSVPKLSVHGSVTVNGETFAIEGVGYHDHQWMNISQLQAWHHWLWGHLYTENYTVVIYDFVANEHYGFTNVPMFGVLDNATGKLIFETDGNLERTTTLYTQKDTGRDFPKVSTYTFSNADGSSVDFKVTAQDEIEIRNMYGDATEQQRAAFDRFGTEPVYLRYFAQGDLTLHVAGHDGISESGSMIYEYPYIGKPDPRARV